MSLIHPESVPGDFLLRIQECPECEADRRPRLYMCSFHDGQLTELFNDEWSGPRDLSTVNPPSLAEITDERDRLRAAITEAVTELNAEHRANLPPGRWCDVCGTADGSWPCVSKMVADDLSKALEEDG